MTLSHDLVYAINVILAGHQRILQVGLLADISTHERSGRI